MLITKYRKTALFLGDILILWVGLFLTLIVRYGDKGLYRELPLHVLPFSIVFAVWILFFVIAGLYEVRTTNEIPGTLKLILYTSAAAGTAAIALFYFFPAFLITPRLNLLIDLFITAALLIGWRIFFTSKMRTSSKLKVLLFGSSPDIEELIKVIEGYPELGYEAVTRTYDSRNIIPLLRQKNVDIVVAPKEIQSDKNFVQAIYETLSGGIRFIDAATFYEMIMGRIPVSLISKTWFLENIAETEKIFFESVKRSFDILLACFLGLLMAPLIPLVAIFIKLDSRGPVLLRQKRVGKLGRIYVHYKYRTMVALGPDGHAELNGVEWT
ncbi:MAG: sugar transferase, partial [Candidatus Ryanbacteria bacterium]|nr:sugar transferase [Candidatus Ryanbacteria bacterium]